MLAIRKSGRAVPLVLLVALVWLSASPWPAAASNDPLFPTQWSLGKIQAEPAWASSRGSGVKVAVLDTGIDFNHEDLAGKGAGSFNCIKDGDSEQPCDPAPDGDDNGHGTQVAGIIAAIEGNGKGIAPVAPDAKIMSFKALGADGSGDLSDVLRAIRSAADNGAQVINLSLGPEVNLINDLLNLVLGGDPRQEFREAFEYASAKGALVVAAAGNSGTSSFFAGLENVYVVGSTGPNDEIAFYSSSGAEVFAPGGNSTGACDPSRCVNSTVRGGGYRAVQGTSFAAPHVSAVAALIMAQGVKAPDARARINDTADPILDGRRVNALRAVSTGAPPAAPPPPESPPPAAPPPPSETPEGLSVEITVPVPPPVTRLVPILVLSTSEAPAKPDPLAARRTGSAPGNPVNMLAAALFGLAVAGHLLFRFSTRREI